MSAGNSIFKAYDVRGQYPDEIDEDVAYKLGRAFVLLSGTRDVLIGRDSRLHSASLAQALARGLSEQGANVTDIGLATTPQVIAMRVWKKHDTAIMITASHLEAPFNGMKLYLQDGSAVNKRRGMQELEALFHESNFPTASHGSVATADYTREYAQRIEALMPLKSKLPFVVDCSNGAVGPEILLHKQLLGLPLILLNTAPDGAFPHHSPDPLAKSAWLPIRDSILKNHAAGGCVYDADADRVVFFDEFGSFIKPNYITCLLVQELLRKQPGRTIAYDLISSKIVPETIEAAGGKALRTVVGRNLLCDDMRQNNALFGAEVSSHMIYADVEYADASTLSMLLILDLLTRSAMPFSQLTKQFAKYTSYERNYIVPNADSVVRAIQTTFADAECDYLDGITFLFSDSWIVVRKSNTEPLLRVRGEGLTPGAIESRFKAAERVIIQQGGRVEYH